MDLSFAILARNEEKNLPRALESIKDWDTEIVVVDAESTDETASIAKKYTDKVISRKNELQLNINKTEAFKHCTREWVFYLDADEEMTPKLKTEIETAIKNEAFDGYWVPRKNIIFGHFMRWGGNYPDEGLRLFRRTKGTFPQKHVHEHLDVEGQVGHLSEPFVHYTYEDVSQWIRKMDFYTQLEGELIAKHNKNPWTYMIIRPPYRFLRNYIVNLGFRDGPMGLVYAIMNAQYEFFAGVKGWLAQHKTPNKNTQ